MDHYSKKIYYKEKDLKKNKRIDRWKLFSHYEKGSTYIRHKQGKKKLDSEYKTANVRRRRDIVNSIHDEDTMKYKEKYLFKGNDIEATKFIDMNNHFKENKLTRNNFDKYHQEYETIKEDWINKDCTIVPINEVKNYLLNKEYTGDIIKIADLGCGKGELQEHLSILPNIKVDSYDLYARKDFIIEADFTSLPKVKNDTYDIIVCCLSMMTQLNKKTKEIKRILKDKGELIIWQPNSNIEYLIAALNDNNFNIIKRTKDVKFTNLICKIQKK